MKWITWILALANLTVAGFFLGQHYWSQTAAEQADPINVERLSLRSQSETRDAEPPSLPPKARVVETPVKVEAFCIEWRGLNRDEFALVRDQLKAMTGERVMSFSEVPLNTRQWVIFPPLPSSLAAAAKLAELAAAGVKDAFVVKDELWRNAISLGLYANAEAAGRRVKELEGKGVLGTQVQALPRQGTDFYFVIKSEDPDALKSLSGIKQAYPNSQQSRVSCPS